MLCLPSCVLHNFFVKQIRTQLWAEFLSRTVQAKHTILKNLKTLIPVMQIAELSRQANARPKFGRQPCAEITNHAPIAMSKKLQCKSY